MHYVSLPGTPILSKFCHCKPEDFPNAKAVGQQTLSLPLSSKLTSEEKMDVIDAVKKILE